MYHHFNKWLHFISYVILLFDDDAKILASLCVILYLCCKTKFSVTSQPVISSWQNKLHYFCQTTTTTSILSTIFWAIVYRQRYRASAIVMPFKVIQGHWFWYQSKARMRLPIIANNTNLHRISHRFPSRSIGQSIAFDGCLSLTHSFRIIPMNIAISHVLPKTRFVALHFCI